jgi:hypothetical protein
MNIWNELWDELAREDEQIEQIFRMRVDSDIQFIYKMMMLHCNTKNIAIAYALLFILFAWTLLK